MAAPSPLRGSTEQKSELVDDQVEESGVYTNHSLLTKRSQINPHRASARRKEMGIEILILEMTIHSAPEPISVTMIAVD